MILLSSLGKSWSLWPPGHPGVGGLHLIEGADAIIADLIISLILTFAGECPLHPSFGVAVNLFQPLSDYEPEYLVYNLEREIIRWIGGIQEVHCTIAGHDAIANKVGVDIYFVSSASLNRNVLVFPLFQYQGVSSRADLSTFLQSIELNQHPLYSPVLAQKRLLL